MDTLLLRLAAPLQSWGMESKYKYRMTERAPSKSAVIGMIASALGRKRNESVDDIVFLRYGVRIDQEGVLLRDYHTVAAEESYETERYYLSDAIFLVGLEGEEQILKEVEAALDSPMYPLYLGRRSCPPAGRFILGIRKGVSLEEALEAEPSLAVSQANRQEKSVRLLVEASTEDTPAYFLRDNPLSFDQTHRKFGFRGVKEYTALIKLKPVVMETMHDPLKELGD